MTQPSRNFAQLAQRFGSAMPRFHPLIYSCAEIASIPSAAGPPTDVDTDSRRAPSRPAVAAAVVDAVVYRRPMGAAAGRLSATPHIFHATGSSTVSSDGIKRRAAPLRPFAAALNPDPFASHATARRQRPTDADALMVGSPWV